MRTRGTAVDASDITVRALAVPRMLCAVRGAVRGYLEAAGFAPDRRDAVVLAVDEACSNVVRHAYAGEEGGLELGLAERDGWLEVRLSDRGKPMPPDALKRKPPAPPDRETVKPGGLGVGLIHEVFEEVDYARGEDGTNVLRLRLPVPPRDEA
jgi:anti-sigma regulatory factor (Ser/Thr protein kinase)